MEECINIPQQQYAEFSKWLHTRVGNRHIPVMGSIELTMRCNLRCQHCYIPLPERASHAKRELNRVEVEHILDEITDAGCLWLLLTGGEPLLRKDFLEIYTYAKRKGMLVTIFTNGTLVTPRIADHLAEWRPFKIEITLYGATQQTYERVTGIPGSYTRCRRGIDLLLDRKLPLSLKTMVMTLNHHELDQMKSLAVGLGVEFRFDPILQAAIDGSPHPTSFRLTPAEVVQIEKSDPERARLWPHKIHDDLRVELMDRNLYICGAGKFSFHINSCGHLTICVSNRRPAYDLRGGSFREGWETFIPKVISRQYSDLFPCAGCQLRSMCLQCPAYGESELRDAEACVEFLCQLTKNRYKVFNGSL